MGEAIVLKRGVMHPLTTVQLTTLHLIAEGRDFHCLVARQRAAPKLRHQAATEMMEQGLVARGPSASGYVLLADGTDVVIRYANRRRFVRETTGDPRIVDATAEEFFQAVESAMGPDNPLSKFVTHYSIADLRTMSARYLDRSGLAGIAAHDHGDGRIEGTALFNAGAPKGTGRLLLQHAVEYAGVNYLECLGDVLRALYESSGFSIESSTPFNPEYAPPNWNEAKFGRPNYYTLVRLPMEFTRPKTAEQRKTALAELRTAEPDEIRSALVRMLKRERPGITQSEINAELAMGQATFGVGF
jgi:hypothetical protein